MHPKSPIPDLWNVPLSLRQRVGEQAGRQRAMFDDGHLLLILHQPPSTDHTQRGARIFWRTPDGAWESNTLGKGVKALKRHLEEYSEAIAKLERTEDRSQRADEYDTLLEQTAPLHRAAQHLHATLQEAREVIPADRDLIICRDRAYSVKRAAELLHGDVQSGLSCAVARRAEEQAGHGYQMARSAHRLNLLAAMFLPLATIGSIFGMNLSSGLERNSPLLFLAVVLIGVIAGYSLRTVMEDRPHRPNEPEIKHNSQGGRAANQ